MVDKAKLDQMLSNLGQYLGTLQRLSRIDERDFLSDPDKIGSSKYHFVVAIECCIDIANHIIASQDFRFPKDNADSFSVLAEAGVLGEELLLPLAAMARFRNRLVHLYWDVEDARVYRYLQDSIEDLKRFSEAIARYVA